MRHLTGTVLLSLASCGGALASQQDGTAGDGGPDVGGDTAELASGGDGGSTVCRAPDGEQLCGGPNRCPMGPGCQDCFPYGASLPPGEMSFCEGTVPQATIDSNGTKCPDGQILVQVPAGVVPKGVGAFRCAPFALAELYARNGASDDVRYADYGLFTGAALPLPPASCPLVTGFTLCGGACGDCPSGYVCTGRSPLHPNSFCVLSGVDSTATPSGQLGCVQGKACFSFNVEPAAEVYARWATYCLPVSECRAVAAQLPGGGTCGVPASYDAYGIGVCP